MEGEVRHRNLGNGNVNVSGADIGCHKQRDWEVNLQRIRDKAHKLKLDAVSQVEQQIQDLVDDFVQEVERIEQPPGSLNGAGYNKQARKKGEIPDKEFIARRSVLTELLEISHIQTIYHIFVAILIVFSLNTIVYDFIDKGARVFMEFEIIIWAFGKIPIVMSMWVCMLLSTVLLVYPLYQYWSHNRRPGSAAWIDYVWLGLYLSYQAAFLIIPIQLLTSHQLPPASAVIITCEQVRLMMKSHAFVRENLTRAMKYNKHTVKEGQLACPGFTNYLYFLFAPTLVYRDNYPRTTNPIRWNYVFTNFLQVLACLFYTYYIFERFCVPVFRNLTLQQLTLKKFVLVVFGSMMPGTLVLFIGFFAILHSWLNAFAEMLRFSDRLFYKDWWNSSSFANYYRTWNVVVHDWLYSYVYKDICKLTTNRGLAMGSVFLLSAVFHEFILSISLGFFYPVLFVMFAGAGFAFIFIPKKDRRSGNVFMWVALFTGNGLLMCLYSMEWYARRNCKPFESGLVDYFTPRTWSCESITGVEAT